MGFLSKSYNADLDVSLKVYSGYFYLQFGTFDPLVLGLHHC